MRKSLIIAPLAAFVLSFGAVSGLRPAAEAVPAQFPDTWDLPQITGPSFFETVASTPDLQPEDAAEALAEVERIVGLSLLQIERLVGAGYCQAGQLGRTEAEEDAARVLSDLGLITIYKEKPAEALHPDGPSYMLAATAEGQRVLTTFGAYTNEVCETHGRYVRFR